MKFRKLQSFVGGTALLFGVSLAGAAPASAASASAAAVPGERVLTVQFSQTCSSGVGVGIAFDGTNLWYSCYASSTDLYRANATLGTVSASYAELGGIGAIAYDAPHNAMWAVRDGGDIWRFNLDANKNIISGTFAFNGQPAGLTDGLAYDAQDNSLYISPDSSQTIYHYSVTGAFLGQSNWAGGAGGCYNSGLAVGGSTLYQGADGCNRVYTSDKATPYTATSSFGTAVPGDSNPRDEGMSCDPSTFGQQVIWSKEAYSPDRANAYAIQPGTCGLGGTAGGSSSVHIVQETDPSITYVGTWTTSNCTCFSGGHVRYATAAGANATLHFSGTKVGIVSNRAPNRGSFKIYLDGIYKATISDYSYPYKANDIVVWSKSVASGSHTLKIVVVGTAGHPRVDLDAFNVTS